MGSVSRQSNYGNTGPGGRDSAGVIDTDGHGTRARLLEAAGEVFAAQGYQHATVRDIVAKAGANIAAVNYHFGDKRGLYVEVIRECKRWASEHYPVVGEGGVEERSADPREQLRLFIHQFMLRLLDRGRPAWHGKLMCREITDPSESGGVAFEMVVEEFIRPQARLLESIIAGVMFGNGKKLTARDEGQVRLCVASVIGQVLHYEHAAKVMGKLYPMELAPADQIERLAEHVYRFSLAAMENVARGAEKSHEKGRGK